MREKWGGGFNVELAEEKKGSQNFGKIFYNKLFKVIANMSIHHYIDTFKIKPGYRSNNLQTIVCDSTKIYQYLLIHSISVLFKLMFDL